MRNVIFILLVFSCCPVALSGQKYCQSILDSATLAYNANNLQAALEILQDAESCDYKNVLLKERQRLQSLIFNKVEIQRIAAVESAEKAEEAALWARYSLAQLFEEKTTSALEKGEYAQAWLYNQQALRMAAAVRTRMPVSAGRLLLREMCPCPELRVPKPETMQGSIIDLAYDTTGQLFALETQVIADADRKVKDKVQLTLLKPGDGIKPLIRMNYDEPLPVLGSQSLSNSGRFVSQHRGEGDEEKFLNKWAPGETNTLDISSTIPYLEATCVKLNHDGSQLAFGNKDGQIAVVRYTKKGDEIISVGSADASPVLDLAFSPGGNQLAAASRNGTVTIWPLNKREKSPVYLSDDLLLSELVGEVTPGKMLQKFSNGGVGVRNLAFSPDGKYLAYGDMNGGISVIELANGQKLRIKPFNKDRKQVTCLAFSPDSKLLANGDPDGYVSIWGRLSSRNWEEIALVKAHTKEVTALAFHPDGTILSSGSKDSTLRQMSLRVYPFEFNRDQALDLSEFFFNYSAGTQAVRREKIYYASFDQLPYKLLNDNKLGLKDGDPYNVQLANARFYGGRAPFNAYMWSGELRREARSGVWTERTYIGPDLKKTRAYTETGRDENWLYLKDKDIKQDHQIRVPLQSKAGSVQLSLGESWIDLNLVPEVNGDTLFTFPTEGIRFGVAPERSTAGWVGLQPGNSGGYTFRVSKTDTSFFYMSIKDTTQAKDTFQIRIPKLGGWAQYQKGNSWINLFDLMRWNQINTPADITWEGRHFIYDKVSLNQSGNFIEVSPGAEVTIDLDWETRTDNIDGFCPGCIVQGYFGIKDVFSHCFISDGMPPEYYWGDSGHENVTFKAPENPGIYYITNRFTLEYDCKEDAGQHDNGAKNALAAIRVMPEDITPERMPAPALDTPPEPIGDDWGETAAKPGKTNEPDAPELYEPYQLIRFQNAWKPKQHIHVETLEPEAGEILPGWWSAQWAIEPVEEAPPYVRIVNRWTEGYLNVEDYTLAQGEIDPGWWSAMWELEQVEGTKYVRIKNRWIEGYLHNGSGQLELGDVDPDRKCAWWWIETVKE